MSHCTARSCAARSESRTYVDIGCAHYVFLSIPVRIVGYSTFVIACLGWSVFLPWTQLTTLKLAVLFESFQRESCIAHGDCVGRTEQRILFL